MIRYTHNGGPIVIDVHPDDKMIYAQWHVQDFLDGVQGMKPDSVGIYSIILSLIYKSMGQLKDNDKFIAGHCNCEIRYYRKLRQTLLDEGKLFEADGHLYNNRAMAEIAKFCEMQKRKREAAALREQRKRVESENRTLNAVGSDASGASQAPDARLSRTPYARPRHLTSAAQEPVAHATRTEKPEKSNVISMATTRAVAEPCQSEGTAAPRLSTEIEIETEEYKEERIYPLPLSSTALVAVGDEKVDVTSLIPVDEERQRAPPSKPIKTRKMGSRLSVEWKLPKSWGDWAYDTYATSKEDIRREAETFRDYWVAKPGSAATKLDWEATWRNWIRNKKLPERRLRSFDIPADSELPIIQPVTDLWDDVRKQRAESPDE